MVTRLDILLCGSGGEKYNENTINPVGGVGFDD